MPSSYPTEVLSTRKRGNRARGVPSPIVLMLSPLPRRWVGLTPDYHSSDPIASLTSKSICCSHHQRCGTAPLFWRRCAVGAAFIAKIQYFCDSKLDLLRLLKLISSKNWLLAGTSSGASPASNSSSRAISSAFFLWR